MDPKTPAKAARTLVENAAGAVPDTTAGLLEQPLQLLVTSRRVQERFATSLT